MEKTTRGRTLDTTSSQGSAGSKTLRMLVRLGSVTCDLRGTGNRGPGILDGEMKKVGGSCGIMGWPVGLGLDEDEQASQGRKGGGLEAWDETVFACTHDIRKR